MEDKSPVLSAKDFESDQEIRWCPGCGDFAILKQIQNVFPTLGIPRENFVLVSGIGCSSRLPYYMNTYGMHTIHGRATAIATGLKLTRADLSVWIITGDGDALSIGGNHLIHLLRRNIDVNILLFNNQIYGLTKGQFSPTSEVNLVTKSSPQGNIDKPFRTLSLALGAGASFVARSIDREAKHLQEVLKKAHGHKGSSFVEIYQNCHIFNDGAFDKFTDRKVRKNNVIFLEQGQALRFGEDNQFAIQLNGHIPKVVELNADQVAANLWIHDANDIIKAQILAKFVDFGFPEVFGVIYEDVLQQEAHTGEQSIEKRAVDYDKLLKGFNSWSL